ncbi:MAG: TatD family hydrolase [Chloroflexota bacterium]|nr:TatD family hydrolase [Chloroflexota bacterium]
MLVDAHAHLDLKQYAADRDETIQRAKDEGVSGIINVGIDPARWQSSLELAAQYPGYIYLSFGLHPNDILQVADPEAVMVQLEELILAHPGLVVGIGETGLDYYWKNVPPETQRRYFIKHIALARQTNLPLVIHCREAMPDLIAVLQEDARQMPIMMHCFSGTLAEAEQCLALGSQVYISLAGPVTFAKATDRHEVARQVPLDRLLVETDSPFLTPHPFRGRRNEPAHVRLVAQKIAELKNLAYEEVLEQTGKNVETLFGLTLTQSS